MASRPKPAISPAATTPAASGTIVVAVGAGGSGSGAPPLSAPPAFVPPGASALTPNAVQADLVASVTRRPEDEAAALTALLAELDVAREDVFAVNLSAGVIVTIDGRKLRRDA